MTDLQLIIIALVQGITEFLPISSSGHLYLTSNLLGWPDQGVKVDAAVHVGTLAAVIIYCWREVGRVIGGFFQALALRNTANSRLFLNLLVGTIPIIVAGGVLVWLDRTAMFRSLEMVAWATIVFGLLLWLADGVGMTIRKMEHMGWGSALMIGLFQVIALVPGASRAGMTMMAGRLLGFERAEAARFSLLLSIPAILAAGGHSLKEIYESGDLSLGRGVLMAMGLAFLTALPAIALMMAWLRRSGYAPFVIYRLALGAVLLAVVYGVV
ncbi:undecaprenyl-diphosphate phosphatase [Minwuia thermotolerans]|uniref:Undecaprenyl-diphosphatase n=1 Tax=Minwuia thermotolerans TaxID=2056226 RepID=A0A2M9FX43_9PROT|nr:undecaprenyl-diphosphate phosphatase [Minwuia thermotolerans]PJK28030.1 undecaprenyl-diphosphatase [Minwuia thermotolerans]